MQAVSAQSGGIMNTDLHWGAWDLQFFGCCCRVFGDFVGMLSLQSQGKFGCNSWEGSPPFHVFVALTVVAGVPSFGIGFTTFSQWHCFSFAPYLFGSQQEVWLLNIFWSCSFCQAGPIEVAPSLKKNSFFWFTCVIFVESSKLVLRSETFYCDKPAKPFFTPLSVMAAMTVPVTWIFCLLFSTFQTHTLPSSPSVIAWIGAFLSPSQSEKSISVTPSCWKW